MRVRLTPKDYLFFGAIALCLLFAVTMLGLQVYASVQCGWMDSMLYGKRVLWAWYFGYCGAGQ